jgi:hypothetical protein
LFLTDKCIGVYPSSRAVLIFKPFSACCGSFNILGKLVKLHFEHGAPLDSMDNLSNDELKELHGGDVLDLLRLKPTLMHIAAVWIWGKQCRFLFILEPFLLTNILQFFMCKILLDYHFLSVIRCPVK